MTLNLTRRQRIALRTPCFTAEETVQRQFFDMDRFGTISSILTLNVGME